MRITLFALLLVASASIAQAQASFALSLGLNAANVSIEDYEESTGVDKLARLGLNGGIAAELPLTQSVSIHPELLYSQQGYKISTDTPAFDGSITAKADYIQLPVLVGYHFRGATGLDVAIQAGPYAAFKLSEGQSCSGDAEAFCDLVGDEGDDEDGLKSLDIGAAAGLEVGAGPFGVGARYSMSLVDNANTPDNVTNAGTIKHQVMSVFARYRFGK